MSCESTADEPDAPRLHVLNDRDLPGLRALGLEDADGYLNGGEGERVSPG